MRATVTNRPETWPSVEKLRELCDEAIVAAGFKSRTHGLRACDLSHATFERKLREGLSGDERPRLVERFKKLGVFELIPRR